MILGTAKNRLAGYAFLIEKYRLSAMRNWHVSSVSQAGVVQSIIHEGQTESVFPLSYWPGETIGDHLEFALKYDGVNLAILSVLFKSIPEDEILGYITSKPLGKYSRRIWFLFEFLMGRELPLPNLTKGNYVEVLEPDRYYTTAPGRRVQRQRMLDNLLGGSLFCPVIRRTEKLLAMEGDDLRKRCEDIVTAYPSGLLRRALGYLYSKETMSSFEIEHIKPSASRVEKFIGLLEMAEHKDFCDKYLLIDVQNRIVDPRFRDSDYRKTQNYVGQPLSGQKQLIHYICPKPVDLPSLMEGLLLSHSMMQESAVPAVVHAAAISYGFVFLHPFEDGNGRIHRFLIHNILSRRGLIPKGLMFPVSAAMLKNPALYDSSLELFSRSIMSLIEYTIDDVGQMTVQGETGHWYQYIDMTAQVEALCDFVRLTIEKELVEELDFLVSYDRTKQEIQSIVDMPDRLIDLFIQLCLQNKGQLSVRKRADFYSFLDDDEVARIENAVRAGYNKD